MLTLDKHTTPVPDVRRLYETMLLIRRFEERILKALLEGKLASGMCHVSVGQEAVAAGVCAALGPGDYVASTHRGHGHLIARGGDLERMMAELFGRTTGYSKGRGGSMHMADLRIGHLGANGIVGGHIGIGTGSGLWSRLSGDGGVTAVFFGDGAVAEGAFHEALNLAGLWKLPIVYVCENNQFAMSLPWERTTAEPSLARKAAAYGMPGVDVDGQDVRAVWQATTEAVARARRGDGPTLIGALTYRFFGHSRADPSEYRDKQAEAAWRARDPIRLFREQLLAEQALTPVDFEVIEAEVAADIERAVRFAEESPPAPFGSAFEDVYA